MNSLKRNRFLFKVTYISFCFIVFCGVCTNAQLTSDSTGMQTIYDMYHVKKSRYQIFIEKATQQKYSIEEIHSFYNVTPVNIFSVEMKNDTASFLISFGQLDKGFNEANFINKYATLDLHDLDGKYYDSTNIYNQVVVLSFWFTSCGYCIKEMPLLNEIVEIFKEDSVLFLAPTFESAETLKKFLSTTAFNFRILPNSAQLIDYFQINAFPTHIILDKESKVRWSATGILKNSETGEIEIKEVLENQIKKYLYN